MSDIQRIIIVGATSAIASHCARLWLKKRPAELVLLGRDEKKLERVAADLKVRSPQTNIQNVQTSFVDAKSIQTTVDSIAIQGRCDIVLIAHGDLPDQDACQNDLQQMQRALEINAVSPVLFAEAFAKHMAETNSGKLLIIGSVAGDRGRKSNYIYGSAKGLVTRYAQGLQHRFAGTQVKVVLIKPGPTDTPMTAHLKAQGVKLASVESVAKQIVLAVESGKTTEYVPGKWWVIMMALRHLPGFIFNKLNI
ncbi:MAG: SDR family NAD(P)-dependent oxidoreductase [Gammaproteobacteria bacterium]|nr:SDR family NAD(P)-dependent oxidoreductase [Gammaproteobacteria bacterium]